VLRTMPPELLRFEVPVTKVRLPLAPPLMTEAVINEIPPEPED